MTHADYDCYQPLIDDIIDLIEKLRVTVIWKSMPRAFFPNRDKKNQPWIYRDACVIKCQTNLCGVYNSCMP